MATICSSGRREAKKAGPMGEAAQGESYGRAKGEGGGMGGSAAKGEKARPRKGGKDYGLLLLRTLGILGVKVSSDSDRYPAPIFPMGIFGDGFPRFGEFHHDARDGFSKKLQRAHLRADRRGLRGGRRFATGKATGGRRETGGIRFAVDGRGLGGTAGNGGGGRIGPVGAWVPHVRDAAPSTLPPLGRLCFRA